MKIAAIAVLLIIIFMNIYKLVTTGFPSYVAKPHLSFIENINSSGVIAPYGHIFIILLLGGMVYSLAKSYYIQKYVVDSMAFGEIISIRQSNTRANNKPLIDIEVKYLDIVRLFKDQPSDYGFEFNKGDLIPIEYSKKDPALSVIPENAIEIAQNYSKQ